MALGEFGPQGDAADRFLEARAELRISRSEQYPLVNVGSSITRLRASRNRPLAGPTSPVNYSDFVVTGGDFSYEADVWGRVRTRRSGISA